MSSNNNLSQTELDTLRAEILEYTTKNEDLFLKLREENMLISKDDNNTANIPDKASDTTFLEVVNNINTYFKTNYNKTTQMKREYFDKINKFNDEMDSIKVEVSELQKKKNMLDTEISTEFRNLKQKKYEMARENYYYNLYFYCGLIQILCLIFALLYFNKTISLFKTLSIIGVLYIIMLGYVIYYIYFKTPDRDLVVFDRYKFRHNKDLSDNCSKTNKSKENEKRNNNNIKNKISEIITEDKATCPVEFS